MLGESTEYRALRHAIEKAHGDRERAIRNVCRLYGVSKLDALPGAIRAAVSGTARRRASTFSGLRCANFRLGRLASWHALTADNMAEAISLTFFAPTRNTWAPS